MTDILRTFRATLSLLLLVVSSVGLVRSCDGVRAAPLDVGTERRVSLDEDWRFQKGEAEGAERADFDDKAWRRLDLPHDWAIEGPFDRKYGPERGALPFFGVGWYRKHFTLPASGRDRFYSIEFDGAMANARVWLNGHELGSRPYGYIGFSFDLTPHLRFGDDDNVLAVRLAPKDLSSRWYPGAGIYRHVWLDVTGPVHVARWGTYVTTPRVSEERAVVRVRTDLRNRDNAPVTVTLDTTALDAGGHEVARVSGRQTIAAGATGRVDSEFSIPHPERWDVDRPYLYRAVSTVREGDRVLDRYVTTFGVRTIEFDASAVFRLNGRALRIQGVCLHHDLGALGTAVNRRAIERQLQTMKTMGANAIRTSHNPPAPELLDAADRLGMLVLDEAFDEWRKTKVKNGHGTFFDEWGERDLRDMIRRDRNHPSVFLWSIGNESLEQADPDGRMLARRLTAICHEEDPTRKVTAGFNQVENAIRNGLVDEVDIAGFNYGAPRYPGILAAHPGWIVLGTETASTVSSRGVYHLPIEAYKKHPSLQITSYDVVAPPWAYAPDVEFDAQDRLPRVIGEFVWTGFDYLGEPTPYYAWDEPPDDRDWPARSSYFGIVDTAGFPKDRYFLYQSRWSREPMIHLLPHWNWTGRERQAIPVFVYTNAAQAELFLNGRSLGRRTMGNPPVEIPVGENVSKERRFASRYRLAWSVPWEPGTLRAVALDRGAQVAVTEVRTAGPPARVRLVPDRTSLAADGQDLAFVTVRIEDANGTLCPTADNLVRFDVTGPGAIAGVDNGNSATVEPFQANRRKAFNGLALLIVRPEKGHGGSIRVVATSEALRGDEAVLTSAPP
jgi:beta-galactosidase